jgi:methylated-DNA-[protein]-cysteine S-methyltransferase
MTPVGFCLFETEIGRCGVAWSASGIVALQLPERSDAATRVRLLERARGAVEMPPPSDISAAVDAIASLLQGEAVDLSAVALDMDGIPLFSQRVYDVARTIPPGATLSYGDIAGRLGNPGAARAVGQALGRNPFPIIVPCHRVLAARGRVGGFSANGGTATKLRLLSIEGVVLGPERPLFA